MATHLQLGTGRWSLTDQCAEGRWCSLTVEWQTPFQNSGCKAACPHECNCPYLEFIFRSMNLSLLASFDLRSMGWPGQGAWHLMGR